MVDNALTEIKTKDAIAMLQNVGLANKKTLVVIPEKNVALEKSLSNIPSVKTILASYINPVDLLQYDKVLVCEGSLAKRDELFA